MKTLREVVAEYAEEVRALGHFNFSDSNQLKALALASKESGLPIVVGLSEGERSYFPLRHARLLVDEYNKYGAQLYLNADHTYGIEKVADAIIAGVDSVVVDGAQLSFEENIALLKHSVALARASGRDVLIEGELGYIGTSSSVMDTLPEGAVVTEEMMTKPDELQRLVAESGIDMVSPAVGNIHGIIRIGQPKLSIGRISELAKAAGVPLVLHGGSGSGDNEFTAAVKAGIVMIHINTDLRVLYRNTLKNTLDVSAETTPYKFMAPVVEAMKGFLIQKSKLFASQ